MKIIFKVAPLDMIVNVIKDFYYNNESKINKTKEYLYGYYPELKNIDNNLNKEEIDKKIYEIVKNIYDKEINVSYEKVDYYTNLWNKYNDLFINNLSKFLNTSWHTFSNEIIGYLGPVPIFPRYPDKLTFILNPNINDEKFIEVVAHECTHFLWFKKISEIYNKNYMEIDNNEWEFSELIVDPILNSQELNSVLHIKEKAYDYFYEETYNNELIMDHIQNIFNKELSIEEKIKESYDYYLEYKKNLK